MWLEVSVSPERYFIVCQVLDAPDGQPDHRHGTVWEFEVR
jgi:hypothetical protein